MGVGDEVECEGTWKVVGVFGKGAQGRVFAVTRDGAGPVRAMKMDIATHGAYHDKIREAWTGKDHLEKGMPHESVPECGILEALEERGISKAPRCFAACQPEGYNTFVMTAAVDSNLKRGPPVRFQLWQKMEEEQRRSLARDSVHFVFDLVRAQVTASDVEAFLDGSGSLLVVDWGGSMKTSYADNPKYMSGPLKSGLMFKVGLPNVPGMGGVILQVCMANPWESEVVAQQRQRRFLPDILEYLSDAFCQLSPDYQQDWIRVTVQGAIRLQIDKCSTRLIPEDFLSCP